MSNKPKPQSALSRNQQGFSSPQPGQIGIQNQFIPYVSPQPLISQPPLTHDPMRQSMFASPERSYPMHQSIYRQFPSQPQGISLIGNSNSSRSTSFRPTILGNKQIIQQQHQLPLAPPQFLGQRGQLPVITQQSQIIGQQSQIIGGGVRFPPSGSRIISGPQPAQQQGVFLGPVLGGGAVGGPHLGVSPLRNPQFTILGQQGPHPLRISSIHHQQGLGPRM